jgi:4-hydroxybenzoate polyprenyltransferase
VRGHWADRYAPPALRPYLRLARIERPIGWWLLLLPCWWSAALAAIHRGWSFPDAGHLVLFLIGAVAMRGAGSTYNDIVDRDLDARVERTRDRPLPAGQIGVRGALMFLALQCLVGLAVLLQFNGFAIATGFASVGIVALYPFMKRVFWLPQIVLGLAFAWGGLMGWAAAVGSLSPAPVALYLGAVAWVVGIRHDLCPAGHRGRRHRGHQILGPLLRSPGSLGGGGLLRLGGPADRPLVHPRRCRPRGVPRAPGVCRPPRLAGVAHRFP